MLDSFWKNIGSDLADRWLSYLFGPAFLFWGGGAALWILQNGWDETLAWIKGLDSVQQGALLLAALLLLVFSSLLMESIRFPLLRILEGYWGKQLQAPALALLRKKFRRQRARLRSLKQKEPPLDEAEQAEMRRLEKWIHNHPAREADLLPTALGNLLRARERAPEQKYGLDSIVCFPRLWLLLPQEVREDLAAARDSLDTSVESWAWGILFLVWTRFSFWAAIISLVWVLFAYQTALRAAAVYGDLLESAFDLYRLKLYKAMGWEPPKNPEEERRTGRALTEFLWRGTA